MDGGEKRRGTGHVLVWLGPLVLVGGALLSFLATMLPERDPDDPALPGLADPNLCYSPSCLLAQGILVSVILPKGAGCCRNSILQSSVRSLPAAPGRARRGGAGRVPSAFPRVGGEARAGLGRRGAELLEYVVDERGGLGGQEPDLDLADVGEGRALYETEEPGLCELLRAPGQILDDR